MKAMLFAAGLGTRLRPLTDNLPKCLVPVNGRPMIDYPLLLLRRYRVREIVVNVHHHADQVEAYLGDGARFGVDIAYSREPVLLDTGGGLLGAREFLDQGAFVIMNSDVLIDLRLDELLRFHRERRAAATLVLRKDPLADAYGAIWTDPAGTIRRLLQHEAPDRTAGESAVEPAGELPSKSAAGLSGRSSGESAAKSSGEPADERSAKLSGPPGGQSSRGSSAACWVKTSGALEQYMFTGVHVVEPRIFRYMDGPAPFSITRVTYPRMLAAAERLCGFPFAGLWQDLGTLERLRWTDARLRQGTLAPHFL